MQNHTPKRCPLCFLPLRRTLKYFLLIWTLALVSSLLYYFMANTEEQSYWTVLNNSFFYINIPLFCFALLSFVAGRGLFNGIRYSMKQAKAYFFKHSRNQMLEEYSASDNKELTHILQEKYLYTSPDLGYTMPLLLATGITFILMVLATVI